MVLNSCLSGCTSTISHETKCTEAQQRRYVDTLVDRHFTDSLAIGYIFLSTGSFLKDRRTAIRRSSDYNWNDNENHLVNENWLLAKLVSARLAIADDWPRILLMLELCMSGHAFKMARRSSRAHTMNAFIGRLMCCDCEPHPEPWGDGDNEAPSSTVSFEMTPVSWLHCPSTVPSTNGALTVTDRVSL